MNMEVQMYIDEGTACSVANTGCR